MWNTQIWKEKGRKDTVYFPRVCFRSFCRSLNAALVVCACVCVCVHMHVYFHVYILMFCVLDQHSFILGQKRDFLSGFHVLWLCSSLEVSYLLYSLKSIWRLRHLKNVYLKLFFPNHKIHATWVLLGHFRVFLFTINHSVHRPNRFYHIIVERSGNGKWFSIAPNSSHVDKKSNSVHPSWTDLAGLH